MKRLMLLGGSAYLIPVIEEAHAMGIYVITVDYLPDNIAHKYSDHYCNISVIDRQEILKAARDLNVDGILPFANDPGVMTAAYVAEQLNLPFPCSYRTAEILQDKAKFQTFLEEHSFNSRKYVLYEKGSDFSKLDLSFLEYPVMVKPVDSSGSKGVLMASSYDRLYETVNESIRYSLTGKVIVEQFIDLDNYQASSDIFVVDGRIVYDVYDDQLFGENQSCAFVPIGHVIPSTNKNLKEFTKELQRLFDLLEVGTGLFNVEIRRDSKGRVFIMEVSPRGGGNHMAFLQQMATDNDIVKSEVLRSVGCPFDIKSKIAQYKGLLWMSYVIHSYDTGVFKTLMVDETLKNNIKRIILNIGVNDTFYSFDGANKSIGTAILCFETNQYSKCLLGELRKKLMIKYALP